MDKAKFLIAPLAVGRAPVILALILLLAVSSILAAAPQEQQDADSSATGRQKVLRRVAGEWMQVGAEQYKRGYYEASKKSFLKAQDYQEYLTADEHEKLNGLLEKTDTAIIERKRILEGVQRASELVERNQLIEARVHLERIQDNEFLTGEERKLIAEELEKVVHQLDGRKREIAELYDRSVGLYRAGRMEAAREGFLKIVRGPSLWGFVAPQGETAEDYLVKIDNILVGRLKSSVSVEKTMGTGVVDVRGRLPKIAGKPARGARIDVGRAKSPEPTTDENSYTQTDNRRRNILRSYTRAVVNDAIAKAQNYREKGEFDRAKKVLEKAKGTVNKNRLELGASIFEQYSRLLERRVEEIIREQGKAAR